MQGMMAKPEQARAEDVRESRWRVEMTRHLTALDEDLLIEGDSDRLSGARRIWWRRRPALDRGDPRRLVRRREEKRIADLQSPGLYASGDDAAFVELIDVLDRQA